MATQSKRGSAKYNMYDDNSKTQKSGSKNKRSKTKRPGNVASDAGQIFRRWSVPWTLYEYTEAFMKAMKLAREGKGAKAVLKAGMAPTDERIAHLPQDIMTAYNLGTLAIGLLNHPEWYENVLGSHIDDFQPGGINFVRDKAEPIVKSTTDGSTFQGLTFKQSTANMVAICTTLTSGRYGSDDAISIRTACEKIMQTITASSGRAPSYTWEDVARYIWHHRQLNADIAEIVRAYEFAQFYSVLDSELPTGYSNALAIDIADIQDHFADIRDYLSFVTRGLTESFPMIDLPIFAQEWWYYGNIFADYQGPQATWIIHTQERLDRAATSPRKWSTLKFAIDSHFTDFRVDTDRTLISDLIRVYGEKMYNTSLYDMVIARITNNNPVPYIVMDPDQLVALQNSTIFRRAVLSYPIISSGDIDVGPRILWEYIYPTINTNAYGMVTRADLQCRLDLQLTASGTGVRTVDMRYIDGVEFGEEVLVTDPYDRGSLNVAQEISLTKSTPTIVRNPDDDLEITSCGSHISIDARVYVRENVASGSIHWKGYPFGGSIFIQAAPVEWPDVVLDSSATNYAPDIMECNSAAIHEMLDVIRCNKDVDFAPKYNILVYTGNILVNQYNNMALTSSGNIWDYTKFALVPNSRIMSYHGLEMAALYTPKEYAYNMMDNTNMAKTKYNSSNG